MSVSFDSLYNKAEQLYGYGRYEDAIVAFSEALAISPNSAPALTEIGRCHFVLGNFKEGISTTKTAIAADVNYDEAFLLLSGMYVVQKKYKLAYKLAKTVVERSPENNFAIYRLARAAAKLHRLAEAELLAETILSRDPNYKDAHNLLGQVYSYNEKWFKAKEHFEAGLAIDPSDTELLSGLAVVLKVLRHFGEASDINSSVLVDAPSDTTQASAARDSIYQTLVFGNPGKRHISLSLLAIVVIVFCMFLMTSIWRSGVLGDSDSAVLVAVNLAFFGTPILFLIVSRLIYFKLLEKLNIDNDALANVLLLELFTKNSKLILLLVLGLLFLAIVFFSAELKTLLYIPAVTVVSLIWAVMIKESIFWVYYAIADLAILVGGKLHESKSAYSYGQVFFYLLLFVSFISSVYAYGIFSTETKLLTSIFLFWAVFTLVISWRKFTTVPLVAELPTLVSCALAMYFGDSIGNIDLVIFGFMAFVGVLVVAYMRAPSAIAEIVAFIGGLLALYFGEQTANSEIAILGLVLCIGIFVLAGIRAPAAIKQYLYDRELKNIKSVIEV